MKIIYLDTEMTGLEPDAQMIQLAYKVKGKKPVDMMFKPSIKIGLEAMAIHHVTNEMLSRKQRFDVSLTKKKITDLLKDHILVAHNAPFDIRILKNEGVETNYRIDTKRVAQHVLDEDRYNLQYLRYSLGLYEILPSYLNPHDALSDIIVLEALFDYLFKLVDGNSDKERLVTMINLSKTPVLIKKFMFGKHKGKTFEEVAKEDRGYIEWLLKSESSKEKEEQNEDIIFTLNYYLK